MLNHARGSCVGPVMSTDAQASGEANTLPGLLERAGRIALFLDFDGVIAELAPRPDAVTVAPGMIARLQTVCSALDGALAVVSGRDVATLDAFLAPLSLALAGDHGNVRRRGNGRTLVMNAAAAAAAAAVAATLRARFAGDSRIVVEAKPSGVAVHYRLAPERAEECRAAVEAAVAAFPEALMLGTGKMVVEARARGAAKGDAVRAFMGEPPFAGRTPVFVGDDVTDEDGFAAAQQLGGIGIKVGPGGTLAHFRIDRTGDVPALLDAVIRHYGGVDRCRA